MDERSIQTVAAEQPNARPGQTESVLGPAHLGDPRALTILTTEHWSLLSARSLVYNEAFARAGMFLTFVTGTLVALGFVSQGSGYGPEFLMVATALLGFDLFIGLATLGRVATASAEELRALQGMNRLRHAYLEMVPTLAPYFTTSVHDDVLGILSMYDPGPADAPPDRPSILRNVAHGLTTTPGMIATITAVVGGAFATSLALLLGATSTLGIGIGFAAFVVLTATLWRAALRQFQALERQIVVRFPSSGESGSSSQEGR